MTLNANVVAPGATILSFTVGAAVERNDAVMLTAEGSVIKTTAITDIAIGVALESGPVAGQMIGVAVAGAAYCRAAAAIAHSVDVQATADGEVVGRGATANTVYRCIGISLAASAAANELIPVLIAPFIHSTAT
jgi:hypothetical protein